MNAIISIHAPHARSDVRTPDVDHCVLISIHAPHARSDRTWRTMDMVRFSFQSTLLMRGATWRRSFRRGNTFYFNPRSSCEERQQSFARGTLATKFQSTLLMRGATRGAKMSVLARKNFNPRSSCEERPPLRTFWAACSVFQSTLLMRGATRRVI